MPSKDILEEYEFASWCIGYGDWICNREYLEKWFHALNRCDDWLETLFSIEEMKTTDKLAELLATIGMKGRQVVSDMANTFFPQGEEVVLLLRNYLKEHQAYPFLKAVSFYQLKFQRESVQTGQCPAVLPGHFIDLLACWLGANQLLTAGEQLTSRPLRGSPPIGSRNWTRLCLA
jgi:hypothetical protein